MIESGGDMELAKEFLGGKVCHHYLSPTRYIASIFRQRYFAQNGSLSMLVVYLLTGNSGKRVQTFLPAMKGLSVSSNTEMGTVPHHGWCDKCSSIETYGLDWYPLFAPRFVQQLWRSEPPSITLERGEEMGRFKTGLHGYRVVRRKQVMA